MVDVVLRKADGTLDLDRNRPDLHIQLQGCE
jgi:hypothetical protein